MALLLALIVILAALAIEHIGGIKPCPLCLQQRWAYYAGIPALFVALVLLSAERPRPAGVLLFLVALAFLANAGLGVYHAGAEWKFWPGPDTCGDAGGTLAKSGSDLLTRLGQSPVVRCDEAALRVAGLSLAGWNAIASFMLFTASLKAAFATRDHVQYL
jgi:disulfide bond formation protein DsbB